MTDAYTASPNVYCANAPTNITATPTNITPHCLPMLQLALRGQTTDVSMTSSGMKHGEQSRYHGTIYGGGGDVWELLSSPMLKYGSGRSHGLNCHFQEIDEHIL